MKAFELELKEIENVQAVVCATEAGIEYLVQTVMNGEAIRGELSESATAAVDTFARAAVDYIATHPRSNHPRGIEIQLS